MRVNANWGRYFLAVTLYLPLASHAAFDFKLDPEYKRLWHTQKALWVKESPKRVLENSEFGFINNPNQVVHSILRDEIEIIWDKRYTIGADGSRVTPQLEPARRKQFLAIFGDSFTFGTGLNDDETLPYFLARRMPSHHVYNLSIGGGSSNMMLAHLGARQWEPLLHEKGGTFVYIPIEDHVARDNGFMIQMQWMSGTAFFEKDKDGRLVKKGTLASAHRMRQFIFNAINSVRNTFFPSIFFNFPLSYSSSHQFYTCDLIAEASSVFRNRFPLSKFVVILHPQSPLPEQVSQCLRDRQVDVRTLQIEKKAEYTIPFDNHPTKAFNEKFADLVAGQLALLENP